ncbi:hypothetical protein KC19_VG146800 [Ceratodon purpureus]|uniref:Secreted protein n=1 Tax=Ceratodon purpureus TaxID=3225 RepID=A0A8T0HQK7_CERPU|nr:hypothetical protein KC19_VG146800 [Ceratodon purpureus]
MLGIGSLMHILLKLCLMRIICILKEDSFYFSCVYHFSFERVCCVCQRVKGIVLIQRINDVFREERVHIERDGTSKYRRRSLLDLTSSL